MKKKKMIVLGLVVALACVLLVGCGGSSSGGDQDLSGSKYLGTWKAMDMSLKGETEALSSEWTLTLKEDGTGISDSINEDTGEKETTEFTWKETSDGFKTDGDTKLTFKDAGDNKIVTKVIGVDLNFEKVE